jgi:putative transcriptional regulator
MGSNDQPPSASTRDFLTGQLLIAMPNMGDPRFERSVVYICAHDEDHAMGVIINKRLNDVVLSELLKQLDIDPRDGANATPVFFGGPVQTERGAVLHTLDYQLDATIELAPDLGLTATKDALVDIAGKAPKQAPPRAFILTIGHAGWGPGQLEQEIAMNAWVHCAPEEAIIFEGAQSDAWSRALAKLGVTSAMLSPEWAMARRDDQPLN